MNSQEQVDGQEQNLVSSTRYLPEWVVHGPDCRFSSKDRPRIWLNSLPCFAPNSLLCFGIELTVAILA